jgi:hypothetical protein
MPAWHLQKGYCWHIGQGVTSGHLDCWNALRFSWIAVSSSPLGLQLDVFQPRFLHSFFCVHLVYCILHPSKDIVRLQLRRVHLINQPILELQSNKRFALHPHPRQDLAIRIRCCSFSGRNTGQKLSSGPSRWRCGRELYYDFCDPRQRHSQACCPLELVGCG